MGSVLDSQVKIEKAANAKQLKQVSEAPTLATFTKVMNHPQKRARPNPPMSVRNPPVSGLEESKDPVAPQNIVLRPQPETHKAQNLPTLQQHVKEVREGEGIPVDQLQKFQNSYDAIVRMMEETD